MKSLWHNTGYQFIYSICISLSVFIGLINHSQAQDTAKELKDIFGLEIYATDPARQKEAQEKKRQAFYDTLPPYILPETLEADADFERVLLGDNIFPQWQPVETEVEVTGTSPKRCCLQAQRDSRYLAENKCYTQDLQLWQIVSIPLQNTPETISQNTPQNIKTTHKNCQVSVNPNLAQSFAINQPQATMASIITKENQPQDQLYSCRVRSQAQCYELNDADKK